MNQRCIFVGLNKSGGESAAGDDHFCSSEKQYENHEWKHNNNNK
jgi:hypothetical protein